MLSCVCQVCASVTNVCSGHYASQLEIQHTTAVNKSTKFVKLKIPKKYFLLAVIGLISTALARFNRKRLFLGGGGGRRRGGGCFVSFLFRQFRLNSENRFFVGKYFIGTKLSKQIVNAKIDHSYHVIFCAQTRKNCKKRGGWVGGV